jgi:hypothetical protein
MSSGCLSIFRSLLAPLRIVGRVSAAAVSFR